MRKAFFLAFSLASMIFAQGAMATDYGSAAGTPISSMVMVSFPDSSTTFQPPVDVAAVLDDARTASMIYINGRTSTNRPSARDEALALKRALSARKYLVDAYPKAQGCEWSERSDDERALIDASLGPLDDRIGRRLHNREHHARRALPEPAR